MALRAQQVQGRVSASNSAINSMNECTRAGLSAVWISRSLLSNYAFNGVYISNATNLKLNIYKQTPYVHFVYASIYVSFQPPNPINSGFRWKRYKCRVMQLARKLRPFVRRFLLDNWDDLIKWVILDLIYIVSQRGGHPRSYIPAAHWPWSICCWRCFLRRRRRNERTAFASDRSPRSADDMRRRPGGCAVVRWSSRRISSRSRRICGSTTWTWVVAGYEYRRRISGLFYFRDRVSVNRQ